MRWYERENPNRVFNIIVSALIALVLGAACISLVATLWFFNSAPAAKVESAMPVDGADLREYADNTAKVTFKKVKGPFVLLGKDLGPTDALDDNWLYVKDPAGTGWIPQGAIKGTIDLSKVPDKDGKPGAKASETQVSTKVDPFAGFAACPYKGTGSSQPEKVNPATFKLNGEVVYAVDLSKLPGCAILFEGRTPWQKVDLAIYGTLGTANVNGPDGKDWGQWDLHLIIDVRSILGRFDPASRNAYLGRNGDDAVPSQYQNWFVYSEGSFWFYDPTWNASDLKQIKPSLAQELEVKKFRDAMKPGAYNYPRIIMQPDGSIFVFWQTDSGDAAYANGISAGCTTSDQPELIPVYGLYDGKQFSAAIGAGNCKMAYWADNSKKPVIWMGYQKDGKEIVSYQNSVIAYMFPAAWSQDQVNTWIKDHPGGK